jgi:hypothetical protein
LGLRDFVEPLVLTIATKVDCGNVCRGNWLKQICARSINRLCLVVWKPHPIWSVQMSKEGASMMKMLFSTLAVAVTLATPALSQTSDRAQGNQLRTNDPYSYGRQVNPNARTDENIRAREQRSVNSRNDVYSLRGEYVGSDPDPNVRDQLGRDPAQGD